MKGVGRHTGQRNMSSWKMGNCIGLFLQLGGNGKSLERNESVTVEFIQAFCIDSQGPKSWPSVASPLSRLSFRFPMTRVN